MFHGSRSLALVALLVVVSLLAGCVAPFRARFAVGHEANEDDRAQLAGAGQFNCVAEARRGGDEACPMEPTGKLYPALGVRALDSFYAAVGLPANPSSGAADLATDPTVGAGLLQDAAAGGNWKRASEGMLPDVITPGFGTFYAVLGHWNDLDQDGDVRIDLNSENQPLPKNEWVPIGTSRLYSFVQPGSHPTMTQTVAPEDEAPDFSYQFSDQYYSAGPVSSTVVDGHPVGPSNVILFYDGSLLQPMRVTTVSDAVLAQSPDGRFPFTPGATSFIDIDDYATVAPSPLVALYAATAAPVVNGLASPSAGSCPNDCRALPPSGPAPVSDIVRANWAPYPREHAPGSGSSNAGRLGEYQNAYADWVDLLPLVRPVEGYDLAPRWAELPLPGNESGELTFPPGWFSFEVRTGLWRDVDGDGFVGTADPTDPYEGGSRPNPDDYVHPRAEFVGVEASQLPGRSDSLRISLTPDTNWGPLGAWQTFFGVPVPLGGERFCMTGTAAACVGPYERGPINTSASARDASPGLATGGPLFFPTGSPGFTVCVENVRVAFSDGPFSVDAVVRDCDHIAKWSP